MEKKSSSESDGLVFAIKKIVKKYPKLFFILNHTLGIFVGKSAGQSIRHLAKGSVILNLGSGSAIIREDVINVDIERHPGVKVVADAAKLPFKNDSVDAIIAESLLEHILDPGAVVKEIHRVLKIGGIVYITTPFIIGFHSSPNDYYRWTDSGLRELLKNFEEKELGIMVGPTNAMTYILREWLALVLSFNINFLRQIFVMFFMVLFAPLNFLDYIFARFKGAKNIAHAFYFMGIKK
ncbi:MAG: class I SAM-dependent methyltransferase [Candidatus Niyogibacteria bacterium]|nr:MAG: class I SAM-dependent methyltransferase [Candidatus Niyogibacteria bacterium]